MQAILGIKTYRIWVVWFVCFFAKLVILLKTSIIICFFLMITKKTKKNAS